MKPLASYTLTTPILEVHGVGPIIAHSFAKQHIATVGDLVLWTPFRYEDRSLRKTIHELVVDEVVTFTADVVSAGTFYKGRRSIQTAIVRDKTGRVKLMWFNNPHIVERLKKNQPLSISGKLTDKGTLIQPIVEAVSTETIHTGRLVPIYSSITGIAPTTLRKMLKHVLDFLVPSTDELTELGYTSTSLLQALRGIHFPDDEQMAVTARERLALEEMIGRIQQAQQMKDTWRSKHNAPVLLQSSSLRFPFTLTKAQLRCIDEIGTDLENQTPMNRLLIGDVGAGKTAVAAAALYQTIRAGHDAVFVAPTQILAEQHQHTLTALLAHIPLTLVTAKTSNEVKAMLQQKNRKPTVFIGTHAVLNLLAEIQPGLLIYDEQHRFGVSQRSLGQSLAVSPHILTLTATPIPRTLMLSLFAHLDVSLLDELPPGRQPVQTWLVPEEKRRASYDWLRTHLGTHQLLVVCPFIDPAQTESLENVAAANDMFTQICALFPDAHVGLLHGRMSRKEQQSVTSALFAGNVQIVVTTPIVEVGVDLPTATFMIIEAAERFGLASLHQLRGRVGRAGQQAYCLLFTNGGEEAHQRLKHFSVLHDGIKLAEMDLERRGAGDLFGTQQHGFDELRFATWANATLIQNARSIAEDMRKTRPDWHPYIMPTGTEERDTTPLAN